MARSLEIGDIYLVKTFCSRLNQVGINIRQWHCSGIEGLSISETEFANDLSDSLSTLYKAYLNAADRYEGITIQRIYPAPVLDHLISVEGAGTGDASGDYLPNQVSGIVTLYTGAAGRANRGRMYLPFWNEADNTSAGVPSAGAKTLMGAVGDYHANFHVFGAGGDTATVQPILPHKDGVYRTITSAAPRDYWATQRRRGLATVHNDILVPV